MAAEIRNHFLLSCAKTETKIPLLWYHRKCYQIFTTKSKLEQIRKKKKEEDTMQGRMATVTEFKSGGNGRKQEAHMTL